MRLHLAWQVLGLLVLLLVGRPLAGGEPTPKEDALFLTPNTAEEPLRPQYSADAAVRYLDAAAVNWQREQKCFSCHTTLAYLFARPTVGGDVPAHRQIRSAAEQRVEHGGPGDKEPLRPSDAVMLAAALAVNDALTTRTLHPSTRRVLDLMWTLQRDDGTWVWPTRCRWPPSEVDEFYGVAMALLAVAEAPGEYARTPQAQQGLEKIRRYLAAHPPATPHQRGMLLPAARHVEGILSEAEKKRMVEELLRLQRPDGGWAFASLGDWQRSDGKPQDTQTSDGYGTGFAVFMLRLAGLSAEHEQIQKGIGWLKTHQRTSGRWYTRSANKDNKHYITYEGTTLAVMALALCNEIPRAASATLGANRR